MDLMARMHLHRPAIQILKRYHRLTIDIDAHAVTLEEDDQGRAHLTRGQWPGIPAGTTDLTYTETDGTSVTMDAEVFDAWA